MMTLRKAAQCTARLLSTATSTYPFSKTAVIQPLSLEPPTDALRKGKGLIPHIVNSLIAPEKRHMLDVWFSRRHPDRLPPGSVLTVSLQHPPYTFSGVLLAMRRRGADTSFVLRNVVQRTGVEMQFFVNSPDVKSIDIIQKAGGGGGKQGRRMRRAKLFYLRDSPEKMSNISTGMRG